MCDIYLKEKGMLQERHEPERRFFSTWPW